VEYNLELLVLRRMKMDKYDQAIEFLKGVEPGSYFDECAELMEELVAQTEARKPTPARFSAEEQAWLKQSSGGARYYAKARGLL
jgi:hypothetical protein